MPPEVGGNSFRHTKPKLVRIVCLTDTHHLFGRVEVPDGDLLLHAGDHSQMGSLPEIQAAAQWLASLPHRDKVVIAGNHDFCLHDLGSRAADIFSPMTYLLDRSVVVDGLTIYGSPWTPEFGRGWAFQVPRGDAAAKVWSRIPDDTQILITHGPPAGICDLTVGGEQAGCDDLLRRVKQVKPLLHLFGHIHEGYGCLQMDGCWSVNGSSCSVGYVYMQPPHVFDWDGKALHPVRCWDPAEPLWDFLVQQHGRPKKVTAKAWKASVELGHAFWVEAKEGAVRFTPGWQDDWLTDARGLERWPMSFDVRLQEYWYRLLSRNRWSKVQEVPGIDVDPPGDEIP